MRHDWVYNMHGGGAESWLGPVFMVVILAVLVAGIVLVVRALTSRHPRTAPSGAPSVVQGTSPVTTSNSAALRILEERYARGEIDRDEFYQRRHDLGVPVPPAPVTPPSSPAGPPAAPPPTD